MHGIVASGYITVWVKKNPPEFFWHFSPNGWQFLVQILHAYYMFLSVADPGFAKGQSPPEAESFLYIFIQKSGQKLRI